MRVLMLVQKPQRRGAEVFAFQLAAEMRSLGHAVATGYLYPYEGDIRLPLLSDDRQLGGDEFHWLERMPGFHPGLVERVCNMIRDFQPDVVQVNGARTVKYGAFAKRRLGGDWKLVYRNIDNPSYWVTDPLRKWFYKRLVMPQLDGIVGVSQTTLDSVHRMYGTSTPAVYIPNGIDTRPLVGLPDHAPDALRQLGVSDEGPVILFMGNLTRQKRPDRFIRVVARVREQCPQAQAWILGSGPLESEVKAQVEAAGLQNAVTFWGYQEQVGLYVAAADLLLVTSDSDGIPAVVLEAGFLGKPTVATNVGGMPECVVEGKTGLVIDAEDENGLAAAVVSILDNEATRQAMGKAARDWVHDNFSMEVIAARYQDFFAAVV